ncbi:hypothetical protein [uncultured Microbacterium sp.]|uniref:hypothetical protein n=1 Tax=uncultured Microbacterium sp. TaxID=191216 RepID=UPI0025F1EEFC|nr:hypothetical protein [uncultured Microbacterium sp.]
MTGPQTFRKKPIEVDAMRLEAGTGAKLDGATLNDMALTAISGWMLGHGFHDFRVDGDHSPFGLVITTLEGEMRADPGDWIIRGVQGEFYPCKPDIFEATYERPVLASAAPETAPAAEDADADAAEARGQLGRAIAAYYSTVEPEVFVAGWVLVTHKLSAEMEREGQSAVGVTTPEQAWPVTRGLLDIALTSERAEQLSSD